MDQTVVKGLVENVGQLINALDPMVGSGPPSKRQINRLRRIAGQIAHRTGLVDGGSCHCRECLARYCECAEPA